MWWFFLSACGRVVPPPRDSGTNVTYSDTDTDVDADSDTDLPVDTSSYAPQPEDPVVADQRYAALFDASILHTIAVDFADLDFAALQASGVLPVPAHVAIDGVPVTDVVAVRMTGQEALFGWHGKSSLHIDFDDYVPTQSWGGLEKFTLDDLAGDPAMANGVIASQVLLATSTPTARMSFATVTVQGTPVGLYALKESIDRTWVSRWFPDASGALWQGQDGCDFTEDSVGLWAGSGDRTSLNALQAVVQTDFVDFYPSLGSLVATDSLLGEWAWLAVLGHDNSWPYDTKNIWAYQDPAQAGRFTFVADSVDQAWNPLAGYDHVVSTLAARCLYDTACNAELIAAIRVRADAYDEIDVAGIAQAAFDLTSPAVVDDPVRTLAAVNPARGALMGQIGLQTAQVRAELPW